MSMAGERLVLLRSINGFFLRCNLDAAEALTDCHRYASILFPDKPIRPSSTQGYCSYTLFVDQNVIQFRPAQYRLDLNVALAAKKVFGACAPSTIYKGTVSPHGLHVYVMERIPGVSYKEILLATPHLDATIRKRLCEDFALFLAQSWHARHSASLLPLGKVGSSIPQRLRKLRIYLPARFHRIVRHVINNYHHITTRLPQVLTHGDVVPSNILLDTSTGRLLGLVDWAEAEMLPFGTCFYGLEEILGRYNVSEFAGEKRGVFVYFADAEQCRAAFWDRLRMEIPVLRDAEMAEAVTLARDLGVLLWYGFAFDDGKIDRVVEEERDCQEICYLDALLAHRMLGSVL